MNWKKVTEWLQGPCISCNEKVAMPSMPKPETLQNYLEPLTGPNEQHELEPKSHKTCINPKCRAPLDKHAWQDAEWSNGWYTCPQCGFEQNLFAGDPGMAPETMTYQADPESSKGYTLNPGGVTHAGLTLKQMGDIGQDLILRMGEIPGVGPVTPASDAYQHEIDVIAGPYGIEIKTNHSQATPIFKLGDKKERNAKIKYCLEHGLKPALVGVRLNFYTDLAYVFFREGFTDTAISNKQMKHVGTFNFKDLNPFQSPDPQARAMEIQNANIPDQATEESEFDETFGPRRSFDETEHPRGEAGRFVVKRDQHELKFYDEKGKHRYTGKRCKHCGVTYKKPAEQKARMECPSCGEDPERKLAIAKIVLAAGSENEIAKNLGWQFMRHSSNGKPVYSWSDPNQYNHIVTGYGDHGKSNLEMAHRNTQKRMQNCMNGLCAHLDIEPNEIETVAEPGSPMLRGQTVLMPGGDYGVIQDIDGGTAITKNFTTGKSEWVPVAELKAAKAND